MCLRFSVSSSWNKCLRGKIYSLRATAEEKLIISYLKKRILQCGGHGAKLGTLSLFLSLIKTTEIDWKFIDWLHWEKLYKIIWWSNMCLSSMCNTHFSQPVFLFPSLHLMILYCGHAGVLTTTCYEAIKIHCHSPSKRGSRTSLEQLQFLIGILRPGTAKITSLWIQLTGTGSIATTVSYD